MYQPDQNRPEANQGMHFHVHQCVCTSPLYNPYRQPMLTPYMPPQVARPYNLAHYQYTSYNVPYNIPVFNPNAIAHQVPATTTGLPIPENVVNERRIDNRDVNEVPLRSPEDLDEYAPNDASTEDFTKFLEQGCIIAEKIAIRNQHRPCFKNIQNLCNRTKNEILKPSHTVSNIHSQGIPWATKDFIYAYVRLINCWHMLKGYLQAKDGTLGNIDRELTTEFKTCYAIWESNTKDLAEHMIRIFSNLDNNVSNPTPTQTYINRARIPRAATPNVPLDIPPVIEVPSPIAPQINEETNQFSETTTEPSPREEESDGESRVYMKPGSYNVPKKNNSSDNSSPSIEFFETAKNISAHYKKLEAKKLCADASADKDWKNAISATPSLIKKNSSFEEVIRGEDDRGNQSAPGGNQNADVENVRRWLYHDHFDQQNLAYPLSDIRIIIPDRPVTLLQRVEKKEEKPRGHLNKNDRETEAMKLLLDELEKTDFCQTLSTETSVIKESDSLQSVTHKLNCKCYKSPALMVQDLKRITSNAQSLFGKNHDIMKQIADFCNIIDDTFPEASYHDLGLEPDEIETSISGNKP